MDELIVTNNADAVSQHEDNLRKLYYHPLGIIAFTILAFAVSTICNYTMFPEIIFNIWMYILHFAGCSVFVLFIMWLLEE